MQRDDLPVYFQSISFVSDTILLFKEETDRVEMVIKDVRRRERGSDEGGEMCLE